MVRAKNAFNIQAFSQPANTHQHTKHQVFIIEVSLRRILFSPCSVSPPNTLAFYSPSGTLRAVQTPCNSSTPIRVRTKHREPSRLSPSTARYCFFQIEESTTFSSHVSLALSSGYDH